MLNATFILKTNLAITEEQYEQLVATVTDFSKENDLYLADVLEHSIKAER